MNGDPANPQLFPDLLDSADRGPDESAAPADLRSAILRSALAPTRYEGFAPRVAAFLDLDRERALELLRSAADAGDPGWSQQREGLHVLHFEGGPSRQDAHCGLVRVEAGTLFPLHRHRGDEWAFVLSGSAREDSGTVWYPGDLVRNPEGSRHSFEVLGDEAFVFVVVLDDWIEYEKP